jgi:GNAT superfamily N-acetyltransferase
MNIHFSILDTSSVSSILPFIQELTHRKFSDAVLLERFQKMIDQNYECVGIYNDNTLIGCCGLWYQMRHYSGASCELDHFFIQSEYRSQGIGNTFIAWLEAHAQSKNCEALELNSYVANAASHKLYFREGFKILGFHFLKKIK